MSFSGPEQLLGISNLLFASEIQDPKDFNQFCLQELKKAENYITYHKSNVPIETCMFHVFYILDYRIDNFKMSLSDRVIEQCFHFISTLCSFYESSFQQNSSSCLASGLSLYSFSLFYNI